MKHWTLTDKQLSTEKVETRYHYDAATMHALGNMHCYMSYSWFGYDAVLLPQVHNTLMHMADLGLLESRIMMDGSIMWRRKRATDQVPPSSTTDP